MSQKTTFIGSKNLIRVDLTTTTPEVVYLPSGGACSVAIQPPLMGTVRVEFSNSTQADINAGQGLFIAAEGMGPGGFVNTLTGDEFLGTIAALRFTASAAGARIEVAQ